MRVIVSVSVFHVSAQTKALLKPKADLGVISYPDTDIVSVSVRSDKARHFGFSSRQRTSRTRGRVTRCRKIDLWPGLSGLGNRGSNPRGATPRPGSRRQGP